MTVHGRYPGVVADSLVFDSHAQDFPGVADATFLRANMPRRTANALTAALTTAVETATALFLREGDLVTSLTFVSAATAADTPLNQYAALRTPDGALVAQSADKTTDAWTANTAKTFALATPYRATETGWYQAGLMVKATTVPTLVGSTCGTGAAGVILTGDVILAQKHGSGLTATAPATIATPTTVGTVPLVIAT